MEGQEDTGAASPGISAEQAQDTSDRAAGFDLATGGEAKPPAAAAAPAKPEGDGAAAPDAAKPDGAKPPVEKPAGEKPDAGDDGAGKDAPKPPEDVLAERAKAQEEAAAAEQWKLALAALAPDWETVAAEDRFQAWLKNQPAETQRRAAPGATPQEAAWVIAQFKAVQGAGELRREADAQGSGKSAADRYALKDLTFTGPDGAQLKAADFWSDSPDMLEGVAVVAEKIADSRVASAVEQATAPLLKQVQQLANYVAEQQFWGQVREKHSDVDAIRKSPSFKEYLAGKGPGVQRMFARGDAEDVAAVLDAYKDSVAKGVKGEHKPDAIETNRKRVVRGAMPGSAGAPARGSAEKPPEEAFAEGFNAALGK